MHVVSHLRTKPESNFGERTLCVQCLNAYRATPDARAPNVCPKCVRRAQNAEPEPVAESESEPQQTTEADEIEHSLIAQLRFDMESWCRGKIWWARIPLLAYFAYVLYMHVMSSQPYRSMFDGINLEIHELGHPLFSFLGEFMCSAGGTITQCMAPIISCVMFFNQRDYFAIAICSCWLATNFWEIAIYAADARALQLNLVAPGMGVVPASEGSIMHDWHYMLGELGWLKFDTTIALAFKVSSFACLAIGLGLGSCLIVKMFLNWLGLMLIKFIT